VEASATFDSDVFGGVEQLLGRSMDLRGNWSDQRTVVASSGMVEALGVRIFRRRVLEHAVSDEFDLGGSCIIVS
jgi:hypothetical protein